MFVTRSMLVTAVLVLLLGAGEAAGWGYGRRGDRGWCALSRRLAGTVVLPEGPCEPRVNVSYEGVNAKGLLHCQGKRPSAVVVARCTEDVERTVRYAGMRGVGLRVRSGGHSVTCSGV
eukprot:Sspe_Gene.55093::Locus_30340_Transcript_1_1_Confidence_1.000_Length_1638::g.55093::m.55093